MSNTQFATLLNQLDQQLVSEQKGIYSFLEYGAVIVAILILVVVAYYLFTEQPTETPASASTSTPAKAAAAKTPSTLSSLASTAQKIASDPNTQRLARMAMYV